MKNLIQAIIAVLLLSVCLTAASCASQVPSESTTPTPAVTGTDAPSNETPSQEPSTGNEPATQTGTSETAASPTAAPEPEIPLTGIRLSYSELLLTVGNSASLTVRYTPDAATNKKVIWSVVDDTIAKVEDGKVTGLSNGTTFVTATSEEGRHTSSCKIIVKEEYIEPTDIVLNKRSLTMKIGDKEQLVVTLTPENVTNPKVVFSTDNAKVAKVDENGLVSALRVGTAVITAHHEDTWIEDVCTVTVKGDPVPVAGVSLSASSLYLREGASVLLKASVLPTTADNQNVVFESDAPDVVSVASNGAVTGLKEGKATVTVTTEEGAKTAQCVITVLKTDEEIDRIDVSNAAPITDRNGYYGGLRRKTSGEILFSPNLPELRDRGDFHDNYEDYTAYVRFTIVNSAFGDEGWSFPSFSLQPQKSKGDWVDFFLQGDGIDCSFCPVVGQDYDIELVIVKNSDKSKAIISGTYRMTGSTDLAESPWYRPSYGPGRAGGEFFISYVAGEHGSIVGKTLQGLKSGEGSSEVTAVADTGYVFVTWSDGVKTASRSGDTTTYDRKLTAYFSLDASNSGIPSMYIYTDSGTPVTSKTYGGASMTVTDCEGHNFDGLRLQIRGRGNSSWSGSTPQNEYNSKNSYRVKFDEKIDLLGIGAKNKDWVLNSNKFDLSGLRNYFVWTLANYMGTLPYVPSCGYVQLYVNNEYRGLYCVSELVETAKGRVEINENNAGDDKGFLIEFDFRGQSEDEPYFYLPGYGDDPAYKLYDAVELVIKSKISYTEDASGKKNYNGKEIDAVKSYMLKCHNAIRSGKRDEIDKYVDIPSLIDMYIIEELSKDCDVGRASFFVQRSPGGKLFFTAPWDFDFGFGTYGPATSTGGLVSRGEGVCPWYCDLIKCDWFRTEVRARMNALIDALRDAISDMRAKGKEIEYAADTNAYFWNLYGEDFHPYVSYQVSGDLYSYKEHVDFIVSWVNDRWNNLYKLLA
ncbi:MAG: Ig-like domain-containing protein [Clostridia bacterium]|nr:Ig-like domain-containing protein [Clostridia bacterium]